MIKKVVLFMLVLLAAVVPVVSGDAGPAPQSLNGKVLDIKVKVLEDEIGINEQASIEVTITNLTRDEVQLIKLYFDIFGFTIDHTPDYISIDTDDFTLGAYESVTFIATDNVYYKCDYYKVGSDYYIDITPVIQFYAGGYDDDDFYYQEYSAKATARINNLFDGSHLIELEWMDDNEYLYCYRIDYLDYDGSIIMGDEYKGFAPFTLTRTNVSEEEIDQILSGQTEIISDEFIKYMQYDEVLDTITYKYNYLFSYDDTYYSCEILREYKTKFMEPPELNMEMIILEIDKDRYDTNYSFEFTNIGSEDIKDFTVFSRFSYNNDIYNIDDIYIVCDLEQGESVMFEFDAFNRSDLSAIEVGYQIDELVYYWDLNNKIFEEDYYNGSNIYQLNSLHSYNLEERVQNYIKRQDAVDADRVTVEPTNTLEAESTSTPEVVITPTHAMQNKETTEIIVTNRQNPMVWLLMIVLVLSLVAAGLIIRIIVKKGKKDSADG